MHRGWLTAFGAYIAFLCGIIAAAYMGRISTRAEYFPHWDTIGHVVLIGLAAGLLDLAWRRRKTRFALLGGHLTVPTAALVIGIGASLEELAQLLSTSRSFDPLDLLGDLAGVVAFTSTTPWWGISARGRRPDRRRGLRRPP